MRSHCDKSIIVNESNLVYFRLRRNFQNHNAFWLGSTWPQVFKLVPIGKFAKIIYKNIIIVNYIVDECILHNIPRAHLKFGWIMLIINRDIKETTLLGSGWPQLRGLKICLMENYHSINYSIGIYILLAYIY